MAIVLTDDEFVTLDESLGLQDSGVGEANEDNNDEDISLASLNAAFSSRLFDAGGLALDDSFAAANGVASNDFISLTEGSTLTGFVKSDGTQLVAWVSGGDPTDGVLAGFTTVDGEAIYLFKDVSTGGGLGAFMFLGVDASGAIVIAGHLQADGTISTVQFEAISNPDSGDHDDPVDLTGLLDVAASGTLEFDLDDLPSGNNLFATLGESPTSPAIVIFGADVILKDDGSSDPQGDVMFFSQAGPNATIGMNNQMFNPGDAAFFVYVNNVNADFLSAWPGGLSSTEANDADNALYTGPTLNVTSAKFTIAQIQGNSLGAIQLTTYLGAADTGRDLLEGPTDGATSPNIIAVKVTIGGTTHTFDSDSDAPVGLVDVSGLGTPTVTILGVDDGYAIEFITDTVHNRVKIAAVEATGVDGEDLDGKFDIGGFVITQGVTIHEPVGDRIVFEDDGPSIADGEGTPSLTVDDSDFAADDSGSYADLFDVNFGTDGGKDEDNDGTVDEDAVTYSLSVGVGSSGLIDTLTGDTVVLSMDGLDVVGKAGAAGPEVFRISVDVNTGEVTLDQSRAVVHDDPDDDEESSSPATLASADLIALTATATDDDGDTDDHTVGIGDTFNFEDDGPTMSLANASVPTLTVDDSDFATNDSADFSVLFTPDYGNDGPLDEDDDDVADAGATTYALGINAGATGLIDTLTGDAVVLSMDGDDVIGTAGAAGPEVFRISVDATGEVTLDQSRAVVHDDPDDDEESGTPAQLAAPNLVTLTATAVDGDEDHDAATANIGLAFNFEDDGPSIDRNAVAAPDLTVDDSDFATDDSADFSVVFDTDFGNDGPLDADDDDVADADAITYELGINAGATGLTDTLTGDAVVLSMDGLEVVGTAGAAGPEVFRISVDADTGEVTLDQSRAVVHNDPDDDEESTSPAQLAAANLVTLTAVAVDGDLDHDDAVANIGLAFNFEDDGPSIEANDNPVPDLIVDESAFGSVFADFSDLFTTDFGNDGFKDTDDNDVQDDDAITYALSISGAGDDTGLIDSLTGQAVLLGTDGLDVIGVTETDGDEVFRVSVDEETGVVTLAQSRAVKHDDPLDPDEELSPAAFTATDLVFLTATAHDGDDDHASAPLDISGTFLFEDDGPALGPISDDMVNFAAGETTSNLLGAITGNDGASVKITDFTAEFDLGFATVIGVLSDDEKAVIYYEDEDGSGDIDDTETNAFFQLSLDDSATDPADWNYVFDVLKDPNIVNIEFDFDNLPSGANLFGVVGESATDPAIIVFGKTPLFNAAGNYTNKSDVIHTSQGGTGATIGVNNQMFDPKEGAYFVYVDDPVANYLSGVPGGLSSTEADDADNIQYTGGTVDVHTASLTVSQTQAGPKTNVGFKITTWLGDPDQARDLLNDPDSGTSPDITLVRVFIPGQANPLEFDADADPAVMGVDVSGLGTQTVTVTGLKNGYTVEWTTDDFHNRALIEATSGKFDVGKFSISESQAAPDASLDFEVTIEDFDTNGDTAVSDFNIGIDGDGDGFVTV